METINVLVVDDSPIIRQILVNMLQSEPGFQVVGQARDGEEAVQLAALLQPDVITMDICMPRMDGLQATEQIMKTTPRPIVVVASSVYDEDLHIAFDAVAAGALTVVEKPKGLSPADYEAVREQLVTTIRLMAEVPVIAVGPERETAGESRTEPDVELIAMAASTGGPGVLYQLLGALSPTLSIPILIVQQITHGFVQGLACWLDNVTALEVAVAKENEQIAAGRIWIAPEDMHMTVAPGGVIQLDDSPPWNGARPSATRLFHSVAETYGAAAVGVVLTGAGEDGAEGLAALQQAGGRVIAQKEEGCMFFGMPQAAIERGIVSQVLSPNEIALALNRLDRRHKYDKLPKTTGE
jgi:two-component system, chemotaxis family, protein-glutamate methylesterase/glutaminase